MGERCRCSRLVGVIGRNTNPLFRVLHGWLVPTSCKTRSARLLCLVVPSLIGWVRGFPFVATTYIFSPVDSSFSCLHLFVAYAHLIVFASLIGRHVCEALGLIGLPLNFSAGGTGGADETGANKDAHQLPVIQLETSCLQSSDFKFLGPVILTTTRSPAFASVLRSAVMRLSFSLRFSTLELEALEVSPMFRPPTDTCPGSSGF